MVKIVTCFVEVELGAIHRVSPRLDCMRWSVLDAGMLLLKIDGVGVVHKGCTWKVDVLLWMPRLFKSTQDILNPGSIF